MSNWKHKLKVYAPLIIFFSLVVFVIQYRVREEVSPHSYRELNLYAMSDYFPKDILKEFERQKNVRIHYDHFSNNEELLAKLQAGATGYDVIVPSDYMVVALIENRLLSPLQHEYLPHLNNIAEPFKHRSYDVKSTYTVPYLWGTTGIAYNSKYVDDNLKSLTLLVDPKYKGRIALLEDPRETLSLALRFLGLDINTKSFKDLQKAVQWLDSHRSQIRIFTADAKQHMMSEDVWIAHTYSGDAHIVAKDKPEVKYFVPKEGATLWTDNLAIPEGADEKELAHEFINYILEAGVGASLANQLGYSTPNEASDPMVEDPDLRSSTLKDMGPNVLYMKDLGTSTFLWDEAWTRLKSR